MKVYVVLRYEDYESSEVDEVFSNLEDAQLYVDHGFALSVDMGLWRTYIGFRNSVEHPPKHETFEKFCKTYYWYNQTNGDYEIIEKVLQ